MSENQLSFDIKVGGNQEQALGSLKKQLKEATLEVQALSDKFGATSEQAVNAAKKAADLKDRIGDSKALVEAFNPDAKFKAFSQTLGAVAGGFSAVQGALGLVGVEGEDVQKTLLKVQSALALSQGLEQLGDLGDAFTNVKTVAVNGFKAIKTAIGSTGIGLIVVALGAIYAYWDDIKEVVSGVGEEQKKLNTSTKENLKAQEDKLSAIDGQSNQLRLQGKSEKDILRLKIAQSTEAIKAAEINLINAKNTKNAQVAAAQRNFEFTKGLLNFLSLPVTAVLAAADALGTALGQNYGLLDKFTGGIAKLVFDPAQVAKDGDATIKEAEGTLNKLKEGKAASQIALQNIDKQGGKASNKDAETLRKEKEAAEKEAQLILAEANKKLKTEQEQELLNIAQAYAEKNKKLELAGIKDNGDLAAAEQKERKVVLDKYAKEAKDLKDKEDKDAKDKEAAFQKELNKITLETKLEGIVDENAKAREQLLASYAQQRIDIDVNENLTAEQKSALKIALATKESQALAALKLTEDKKNAAQEITNLDKKIADNENDLQKEKDLLDQKSILLKDAYAKNLITEDEYKAALKANSKAKQEIDKEETAAKIENAQKISSLLTGLSDLAGKETAAGKTFAIASATIDTYLGATKAYQSLAGIPIVGPALGAVAAGVAIAGGIKNVKSILAVKVPGGGGGGGGNISAPSLSGAPIAPPQPQAQTTTLDNRSINAIGNQTTRAYVVESDVTGSQQRMAAIQQRARFG
jgi:hypothetical protein